MPIDSNQIAQMIAASSASVWQTPPLVPTALQAVMYGPQTPAGLQAAQQLGPALLGQLISPQTPILGAITQGAMNRANMMGAIGQIAFPGGGGPMGMGFGGAEREAIYQQARQQQVLPQATMGELAQMIGAGAQMGAFTAVRNTQDFKTKFTELLNAVKQVTQVLGTSLQEAMGMMQSMRGFGFFGSQGAASAITQMFGAAYSAGMAPSAFQAGIGAMAPGMIQAGVRHPQAFGAALRMQRTMGTAYSMGILQPEQILESTGLTPEAGGIQALGGSYLAGAARRMRHTGRGAYLTAAMLDPNTGGIDPEMLTGLRTGMGPEEIQRQGTRRAGQYGQLDWTVNRNRLAGQVMEREPFAELLMYRNMLQQRGIRDMTSSRAQLQLSRWTGMSLDETAPISGMLQNLDQLRIEEQIRTFQANRATQARARSGWGGPGTTPDFLRGLQQRVQGLTQRLDRVGEDVGRSLEEMVTSRLGEELSAAEGWVNQDIAKVLTGGAGGADAALIQRVRTRSGGMGMGGGGGGPGRWYQPAPGNLRGQDLTQWQNVSRMFRGESYLAGGAGMDPVQAAQEAHRRVAAMPASGQELVADWSAQAQAGLGELSRGMRTPITSVAPGMGRLVELWGGIGAGARGEGAGQIQGFARRMQQEIVASTTIQSMAGAGAVQIAPEQQQRLGEIIGRDIRDRVAPSNLAGAGQFDPITVTVGDQAVQVSSEDQARIYRQAVSRAGGLSQRNRETIERETMQGIRHLAQTRSISGTEITGFTSAGRLAEKGLGIWATKQMTEMFTGMPTGMGDLRRRAETIAAGIGSQWSGSRLMGFWRSTSKYAMEFMRAGEKDLGTRTVDELINSVRGQVSMDVGSGTSEQALKQIYMRVLERSGLGPDAVMTAVDSVGAEAFKSEAGLRQALQVAQTNGAGNLMVHEATTNSLISGMFTPTGDTIASLREKADRDPSLGPLLSQMSKLTEGATLEGVGRLAREVFSSSDPKEVRRRLTALSESGFEYGASMEAAAGAHEQLRRARGAGGRRQALLGVMGRLGADVGALRDVSTEVLGQRAAGVMGGEAGGIQQYLERGGAFPGAGESGQSGEALTTRFLQQGIAQQKAQEAQQQAQYEPMARAIATEVGKIGYEFTLPSTSVTVGTGGNRTAAGGDGAEPDMSTNEGPANSAQLAASREGGRVVVTPHYGGGGG